MNESVNVVIFNLDRSEVLLVKRRDIPVWVLPGGGIDADESPDIAAVREALEETGYRVTAVRKVGEYLPVNKMTKLTHLYECLIVSGEPKVNNEVSEIKFFPLNHLPKLLAPPYLGWIRDTEAKLPFFRKPITGVSYWILFKLLIQHPILVTRYLLTKIGIHIQ